VVASLGDKDRQREARWEGELYSMACVCDRGICSKASEWRILKESSFGQ
jgi:hypothetical protein